MAIEHSCSHAATTRCPVHEPGRPRRKKCPVCGSDWTLATGVYAVVKWRGDGRYRIEEAIARYSRRELADERAIAEGPDYVSRFLSEE